MTPDKALAVLRDAGIEEPGWHVRKLEAAGCDLTTAIPRILAGEPVHRVAGRREFHGLDFMLGPDTLEPRDDTETLVSLVLDHAAPGPRFADLGTGPGTIGLALASELSGSEAWLTDVSDAALGVAAANAERLGIDARCVQGGWLQPLEGTFDFLVSNPPYIRSEIIPTLDPSVRDHDPHLALDGGVDGLDAYRVILGGAAMHLKPGGFLALEIGYDQLSAITELAESTGWRLEEARQDLGDRDRAILLRPNGG